MEINRWSTYSRRAGEVVFLSFRLLDEKRLKLSIWISVNALQFIFMERHTGEIDMLRHLKRSCFDKKLWSLISKLIGYFGDFYLMAVLPCCTILEVGHGSWKCDGVKNRGEITGIFCVFYRKCLEDMLFLQDKKMKDTRTRRRKTEDLKVEEDQSSVDILNWFSSVPVYYMYK